MESRDSDSTLHFSVKIRQQSDWSKNLLHFSKEYHKPSKLDDTGPLGESTLKKFQMEQFVWKEKHMEM